MPFLKTPFVRKIMTLTNYWWPLIWLFLGGAIFSNMPRRRELVAGRVAERWQPLAAFLFVLPYIIWAGFRGDIADSYLYRLAFQRASTSLADIPALFMGDTKDPGFKALEIVIKMIVGNRYEIFFLIIATFQMLSMMHVFRKYSHNFWIPMFMFIASAGYISWMMNGVRQFIAVTIVFLGFGLMLQKKYLPLIITIVFASIMHQSVLMMIPVVFIVQGKAWNIKTILMLCLTMVMVMFIDRFVPVLNELLQDTQYDNALADTNDDGTNVLRVMVGSVPALLSLLGLKYVREADDPVINLSVNCSIVTLAIYLISMVTSGIYIGRLPIYTTLQGYIAMPWLIDHVFERRSAQLVTYTMIAMYCVFYYYQVGITWNYL